MDIRQRIFERRILKVVPRKKQYRTYDDIKSVMLIFEDDIIEHNEIIEQMITRLKNDGKDVVVWGYRSKKKNNTTISGLNRLVERKDVNLFHIPHREVIVEMLNKRYDLLIDLRLHPCIAMQYLTLYVNADLKSGADIPMSTAQIKLLDFMIKIPKHDGEATEKDLQLLFDEIIRYLMIIKQTSNYK